MNVILVIAAHPDDEALGCGGTLARLADAGAKVYTAFLADGVSARRAGTPTNELDARRAACQMACGILGVEPVHFGEFADNRLDGSVLLDIIKPIEELIEKYRPDTVFTHFGNDLNIDHQRVHSAVATACRPQQGHCVKTLLCFEVPSSTEWQLACNPPLFAPNWHVDISGTLERKLAALDAYALEMRPWPHSRSRKAVEHLARWRGATVGLEAAEAFVLGRHLA